MQTRCSLINWQSCAKGQYLRVEAHGVQALQGSRHVYGAPADAHIAPHHLLQVLPLGADPLLGGVPQATR